MKGKISGAIEYDAVLAVASAIEPDKERLIDWFLHDTIAELDGETAAQAVIYGHTLQLLRVLEAVRCGEREA